MKRFHWHSLRTLFAKLPAFDGQAVPDGELLERFVHDDSAAFELLVCRYAETVFGTCARICRDAHDAEDAFQATFLVLARKAKGIRRSQCLAGWLHRVAHRAATHVASKRMKLQRREQALVVDPHSMVEESNEVQTILDAEINRLTDRYRLPILLCYLQGLSTDTAAKQLCIPRGTVLSRLATARQKLQVRLTRRGITVPSTGIGLFGLGAGQTASASLVSIASQSIIIPSTSTSTTAGLLAREILHMTAWKTITAWATAFVAVAGLGGTVIAVAASGDKDESPVVAKAPGKAKPVEPPKEEAKAAEEKKVEADKQSQLVLLAEQRRIEQRLRLEIAVEELEKRAHEYRDKYAETLLSAGHPEYDAKVLADAITKIDAARLVAEDEKDQGQAGADTKLVLLKSRRDVLTRRLLKQEAEQSERNFRLELLKRDMVRIERLGGELRTRLEYLKLGLEPQSAAPTDPAIQKLIEDIGELKLEMRKLAEAKK